LSACLVFLKCEITPNRINFEGLDGHDTFLGNNTFRDREQLGRLEAFDHDVVHRDVRLHAGASVRAGVRVGHRHVRDERYSAEVHLPPIAVSLSFSADIHLNVLDNNCGRMYL
jgi:hypothetical protein